MNNLYYIIGGIFVGVLILVLLKLYFNGGVCHIHKDLRGKIFFVTGGNTGIGAEAAIQLGMMGATIVIACRDIQKAQAVQDKLQNHTQTYVIKLDLTDLDQINACVDSFQKLNLPQIDVLINNAGIMAPVEYKETRQQFEIQFGTNHIGHFYLTSKLLPYLQKAQSGRVVNLASTAHGMANLDLLDLNCKRFANSSLWSTKHTWTAYGNSKLCNILHAMEINQRYQGISACSVHPGVVRTNLFDPYMHNCCKKCIFTLIHPFWWFFTKSQLQGAQTTIQCALEEDAEFHRGAYYSDCVPKRAKYVSPELAAELWDKTVELLDERGYKIQSA